MVALLGNVVWPALLLNRRLLAPGIIAAGLLLEWAALARGLRTSRRRALLIALAANAASALAGMVPVTEALGARLPALAGAGLHWEFLVAGRYNRAMGWGTFNPATWAASYAMAFALNVAIEGAVVLGLTRGRAGWRGLGWLALGNAASLLITALSLWLFPAY